MKKTYWIGIVIIIGFAALAFGSLSKTLTPYRTISEARQTADVVQVAGAITKSSVHYDIHAGELRFEITDKTGSLPVLYKGELPGNFDQADRVVVNGTYDKDKRVFSATKLLVKCPSKYQGAEAGK